MISSRFTFRHQLKVINSIIRVNERFRMNRYFRISRPKSAISINSFVGTSDVLSVQKLSV